MDEQYFKTLLRGKALKATHTRLSLLIELQKYESAMPYSAIQKAMASIDRVTLYRTLERLKEEGVIHKAHQDSSETYYAICGNSCKKNDHQHNHVHFKCIKCASVTCEKTNSNVEVSVHGYDVHSISIHIEGVCKSCKKISVSN